MLYRNLVYQTPVRMMRRVEPMETVTSVYAHRVIPEYTVKLHLALWTRVVVMSYATLLGRSFIVAAVPVLPAILVNSPLVLKINVKTEQLVSFMNLASNRANVELGSADQIASH